MEATMSERTSKKPGIADAVAARRKHKGCFLDEIDRLIDWKPFEKVLRQKLKRVVNAVGNPAYPPLLMFKILLLQRWYKLSDMAVEEALCDRLSFVRFTGLSLDHDEVPDATTICRFRQGLVERNILKRLLDKLNHPLERQGLLVREGTIVDTSVVSSARRPIKVLDVLPEDREEDSSDAPDVTISYSTMLTRPGCARATGRITATKSTPPRTAGTASFSVVMPPRPIGQTRKNSPPCWMKSVRELARVSTRTRGTAAS